MLCQVSCGSCPEGFHLFHLSRLLVSKRVVIYLENIIYNRLIDRGFPRRPSASLSNYKLVSSRFDVGSGFIYLLFITALVDVK